MMNDPGGKNLKKAELLEFVGLRLDSARRGRGRGGGGEVAGGGGWGGTDAPKRLLMKGAALFVCLSLSLCLCLSLCMSV